MESDIKRQSYFIRFIQKILRLQKDMDQFPIKIILIVVKTVSIMLLFTSSFYNQFYNRAEFASILINLVSSLPFYKIIIIVQMIASILQMALINFNIIKKMKKHFYLCKILYIISNLLTLYYVIAINKVFSGQQQLFHSSEYAFFTLSVLFLPIVLVKIYLSAQTYVFGILTPPIIVFYLEIGPLFTVIPIIVYCLYTFNKQQQKIFIWKTWILMSLSLFMMLNSYEHPKGRVSLFTFWFAFMVITILIMIETHHHNGKNNYFYLLSFAENMKTQDNISYETKEYLHLSVALRQMVQDQQQKNQILLKFKPKNKKYLTKIDILNFLQKYVYYVMNNDQWKVLELKIAMGKDIYDVYEIFNSLQCKTLSDKIKYEQLKGKFYQNFEEQKSIINLQQIIKLQKNIVLFYSNVNEYLQKCHVFYQYLAKSNISQGKIIQLNNKTIRCQQYMQSSLQILQTYRQSPKQRKILKQLCNLKEHYDNQVTKVNYQQNPSSKDRNEKKKYIYNDFILIKNKKIENLSINMLQRIGKKAIFLLQSQFQEIVNKNILNIISTNIKQYQMNTFYLPICIKNHLIVLKSTVHIMPTQNNESKYLYLFDQDQSSPSAFLYDYKNDNIIGFSPKAYKENPCLHQFNQMSQHSFSNKFFQIDLFESSVFETLRAGNQIKTHFNKIQSSQNNRITINLKFIQQFKNSDEHFAIVALCQEQIFMSAKQLARISQPFLEKSQFTNKTFCPIENPYKQKLIQKFEEIRQKRMSAKTLKISIIVILMILALTTCAIMSMRLLSSVNRRFNNLLLLSHELTDQYGTMMHIFYLVYLKYHMYKHPQSILSYNPNFNITAFDKSNTKLLEQQIAKIQQADLNNRHILFKPYIQYKIQFQSYNISYNTHQAFNALSLFTSTKEFITTLDINYHANNYQTYKNLESSYTTSSYFDQAMQQIYQQNILFILINLSIMFLLLIIIIILLTNFNTQLSSIYELSSRIIPSQIEPILKSIEQKRRQLKILKYLSLDHKDKIKLQIQSQNDVNNVQNKFNRLGFLAYMTKGWILFLITSFFIIILAFHYKEYTKQSENFIKIHDYLLTVEQSHNQIVKDLAQVSHNSAKKYLDKTYIIPQPPAIYKAESYFKDDELPQYFSQFRNNAKKLLYGDLCIYSYLATSQRYQNISCNEMQDNAMGLGYSVAFQKYQDQIYRNLAQVPYAQLFTKRSTQKRPVYIDITYMRRILMHTTNLTRESFKNQVTSYIRSVQRQNESIYNIYFAFIGIILLLSLFWMISRKHQCQNVINFARSIPKTTLFSIKNAKHLLKIKFLQNLQQF